MIQKLEIENYQSHKNTTLDFSPGVNAIIGQSDSGKTSILRAMRWVIENRPGGDAFRSSWGGKTSVKITTGPNIIERVKDKTTINAYTLSTGEKDLSFTAMGTSVPEEVQNALNINPINYQNQLDSPFLLDNSPGECAAHFNKIAHLDIIDVGLRNVKSWISGLQKTISIEETRVAELEQEQSKYNYLPAMEKEIIALETLDKKVIQEKNKKHDLQRLQKDISGIEFEITQYTNLLSLEQPVRKIIEQFNIVMGAREQAQKLDRLLRNIKDTEKAINSKNEILNLLKPVSGVLVLIQKEKALQNEKSLLTGVISGIKTTIQTLKTRIVRVSELQKEFEKNFPEICPLCGRSD
jgi:AAA15 family ATPase/GTPase